MKFSTTSFSLIALAISLNACGSGYANHPTFTELPPTAKEYKDDLAEIIKSDPEGLTFYFVGYLQENGLEYLNVKIKGDDFEAKGFVLVKTWNKLEGIKRTKGLGYSGAELRGLKVAVEPKASGAELVFEDLERIVD